MSQTKAQLLDTLVASLLPASDSSVDIGSNAVRFANIYGDTLYGNGANLTGINTDLVSDTSPQLGGDLQSNGNDIDFADNDKAIFGTGSDLEIFHNGSNSFLDNNTGNLYFRGSGGQLFFRPNNSEDALILKPDGAVELYYDNSKRIETTSTGITISGSDTTGSVVQGDFRLKKADTTQHIVYDASNARMNFADSVSATFGDANDLQLFHDGSDSFIKDTGTGALKICSNLFRVNNAANDEAMIKAEEDAGVTLSFNGSTKFETQSAGVEITGKLTFATEGLAGGSIDLGIDADLNLYHDGSDGYFDNNTGDFYIRNDGNSSSEKIRIQAKGGEQSIICYPNGAVELYHDNTKRLETKGNGIELFGYTSIEATSDTVLQVIHSSSGDTIGCIMRHGRGGLSGFSGKMISFRGNDNTEEGSIVIGTTNTAFNTSSDYRLKENEVTISDGITRLKTLKPYTFNFKKDPDVKVDGFFAHEVSSVVPVAVTGTKDQVDEDNNPVYQGIDQSKLVPLLTAALQEAITKIETLETKVSALEG